MEIVVEFPPEDSLDQHVAPKIRLNRKPVPESFRHQNRYSPIDTSICDIMTWDSSLSPQFVKDRWPEKNVRFIQVGRAFAPIHEMPIAQIPYLIVAAKYFDQETITYALQPFLNRKLRVALRDIDWLMVNYSKQF